MKTNKFISLFLLTIFIYCSAESKAKFNSTSLLSSLLLLIGNTISNSSSSTNADSNTNGNSGQSSATISANTDSASLELVSKINHPFLNPYGIAVDSQDNLYVSYGCHFDRNGILDSFDNYLGFNYTNYPNNCTITEYKVLKFDKNGTYLGWIAKGSDGISGFHSSSDTNPIIRQSFYPAYPSGNSWYPGELNKIRSLYIDTDDTLYVLEEYRIHKFSGTDHSFLGTLGHGCDANCMNLYNESITLSDQAELDFIQCFGQGDPNDQVLFSTCYQAYLVTTNQAKNIKDQFFLSSVGGWHTNPKQVIATFVHPSLDMTKYMESPMLAQGISIYNNQIWVGYMRGSTSGDIRIFNKTTGIVEGWFGKTFQTDVYNVVLNSLYGYQDISNLSPNYRPVNSGIHSTSPGAFSAPRSHFWYNNLLYVADNLSDPVLTVFKKDGTIVNSRSHSLGDKPFTITVNKSGYVVASNMYTGVLEIYDPNLKTIGTFQLESPSIPNKWYPIQSGGFAWDSNGYLYTTVTTKNEVHKYKLIINQ